MRIKRFVAAVILSGVAGILFSVFAALPVAALSVSDYFTYSYNSVKRILPVAKFL